MKKKRKLGRKLLSFLLTLAMVVGLMPGMGLTAYAADGDTSYTLTIPSTLNVANSGWNATDGISATGSLASGKKLTVTATSANSWALKSGDNSVGYKLVTASTDTEATTSWTFDSLSSTATKKDMGIIVEDYSTKPAGTYQDTVTFTAKVESATLAAAFVDGAVIKVSFKWRGTDRGDYVQGVYNASSGTFTVSKGGGYWGDYDYEEAMYKVEKSGDNIIIGAANYGYDSEGMVWTFNTTNDTYTYTQGTMVSRRPDYYGLTSVTLNGTDITSQLTKN